MGDAPEAVFRARIQQSLSASRREGVLFGVTIVIVEFYLVPFALYLGASASQIGVLVALPNLLAAASQFVVVDILRLFGDRRRLLLSSVLLQALALAPLPFESWFRPEWRIPALLFALCAFRITGAVMGPPWGSLMSDYLPEHKRGSYFGRRSQLVAVSGIVSAAVGGSLLYFLTARSQGAAFLALFAAALGFRAVSYLYMSRMMNLPEHDHPRDRFDWRAARRKLRSDKLVRFIVYVAAMTFAAQLSGAYLGVHVLRDLHFDYLRYTALQLSPAVAGFLSYPLWGRHADIAGNARVIRLNGMFLPLIPVLWCLTEKALGLVAAEAAGGFLWAGFNLCTTNYVYDAVPPAKRVKALGYFNLINGAALFLGAWLGGVLADKLPPALGYRLHTLFLIAAFCRFASDFALGRHFDEVRATARHVGRRRLFFSVVGLRPLVGDNRELEWDPPASVRLRRKSRLDAIYAAVGRMSRRRSKGVSPRW